MAWLHAVVDVPGHQHETAATFWSGALGWDTGRPWSRHPELLSFEPPRGTPYVHLQRIDGPPRVHVDLEFDDPAAAVSAAVELGAELVAERGRWTTMRSPGGLPFCVLEEVGDRDAPAPVTWPGGHRARMVQVCIDSPAAAHEQEVAFWHALLPGRWASSDAPEFAGKWHDDDGSPLQLLFQRLEQTDGPVRAHLDHGADDVPAEVRRLLGLGASDVAPGTGWHVLRDPVGLAFCVTGNSPEQSRIRDIG
jgi:hypothetical protein